MIYLLGFIATIFAANWMIGNVGTVCVDGTCLVPVGFGLMAPSGVLAIGLGFTLRDLVQRKLGIPWTIFGIIVGTVLSAYLSPALALASGTAFLFSELLDLLVYTPLQKRNLIGAVLGSNVVALVVDSALFLSIAQIPMMFLLGQVIGKLWMTLLALPIIWIIRTKEKQNVCCIRRGKMSNMRPPRYS